MFPKNSNFQFAAKISLGFKSLVKQVKAAHDDSVENPCTRDSFKKFSKFNFLILIFLLKEFLKFDFIKNNQKKKSQLFDFTKIPKPFC